MARSTEILEPLPRELLPRLQRDDTFIGDWSWVPFRNIDEQTLFQWLERLDMELETRSYAKLIREELKRRQGVWAWWE